MSKVKRIILASLVMFGLGSISAAQADSVYLDPASSVVSLSDGTVDLNLYMDFSESTVGGRVEFLLNELISVQSFTPSTYFNTAGDPSFSSFGADAFLDESSVYRVKIGNFGGLIGNNLLGTLTLNLLDSGAAFISMVSPSSDTFTSASTFSAMSVDLLGADITISDSLAPVPVPAAIWLLGSALFGLLGVSRRRQQA